MCNEQGPDMRPVSKSCDLWKFTLADKFYTSAVQQKYVIHLRDLKFSSNTV